MLELPDVSMVTNLLDMLEIYRVDDRSRRGVVGEAVTSVDLKLLQLQPLRQFIVGEIVALLDEQGAYRYAKVREFESGAALAAESKFEEEDAQNDNESAHGADGKPAVAAGAVLGKAILLVGEEKTKTVSTADIYCFKTNISESNSNTQSNALKKGHILSEVLKQSASPSSKSAGKVEQKDRKVPDISAPKDEQADANSEFVDVVSSLLLRAICP